MAKTLYPLPAVVDPPERLCVRINIPNEDGHRAAFLGAIYNLTRWYSWGRDSSQTAKAVADVWLTVWEDMLNTFYEDCPEVIEMGCDVRQNPETPCILEKDCGDGWIAFANLQACPPQIRISGGSTQWFNPATEQWEDITENVAPQPEPRPETGGANQRCAAAANAAEVFRALHIDVARLVTDPLTNPINAAAVLAALIASLFIIPIAAAALLVGLAALIALSYAWDVSDFDLILDKFICILFCNSEAQPDGRVTFAFFNVLADINAEANSASGDEFAMWTILTYYLGWVGGDGLNVAGGVQAGATFDCSTCDDCPQDCPQEGTLLTTPIATMPAASTSFTNAYYDIQGQSPGPYGVGANSEFIITLHQEYCIHSIRYMAQGSSAGLWQTANVYIDGVFVMTVNPFSNTTFNCTNTQTSIVLPEVTRGSVIRLERLAGLPGSGNYNHSLKCFSIAYYAE